MKNFKQFVDEAVETSASAQAKKMGLTGNGHGDWYNSKGELIAKTVDGELKVFDRTEKKKEEEKVEPKKPQTKLEVKQQKVEKQPKGMVVVFGRFNPPTVGFTRNY